MKKLKLSAYSIALATSTLVQAGGHMEGGLLQGASMTLNLKNFYWNENGYNEDASGKDGFYDRREWVQGLIASYKSGFFMDMIGFDITAGSAFKLDAPMDGDKGCNPSSLPRDGSATCDVNDISGIHEAFVKAKFGSDDRGVLLTAGQKIRRNFLTHKDSTSRMLPSSTFGYDALFNWQDLDLYVSHEQQLLQ
jgi:hypothetical protein